MAKWKTIKGYENYMVSDTGMVKSLARTIKKSDGTTQTFKERILKGQLDKKNGYMRIQLYRKTFNVHRLIAIAFIPNTDNKPQVNHIDGVKTNNNVSNLEWATNSENQLHAYKLGLNKRSDNAGIPKKPVKCLDNGITYESVHEASRQLGVDFRLVSKVINGNRKHTGGYHFEFA